MLMQMRRDLMSVMCKLSPCKRIDITPDDDVGLASAESLTRYVGGQSVSNATWDNCLPAIVIAIIRRLTRAPVSWTCGFTTSRIHREPLRD